MMASWTVRRATLHMLHLMYEVAAWIQGAMFLYAKHIHRLFDTNKYIERTETVLR